MNPHSSYAARESLCGSGGRGPICPFVAPKGGARWAALVSVEFDGSDLTGIREIFNSFQEVSR
jgi:hypothetical protein